MKRIIIAMALTLVSFQSFATSECGVSALEVARVNLDQKARAYGFEDGSAIEEETLVLTEEGSDVGSSTYKVDGYIYKAGYTVTVRLDSSCGLESLKIEENL